MQQIRPERHCRESDWISQMKMLNLPVFNVPELPDKTIPPDKLHEWHLQNIKHLKESGQLENILKDPLRTPSSQRFVLK